jgi:hypothetical protein
MSDEIMRGLWAVKDQLARECGHELRRLFERLKSIEAASPRPVVDGTSAAKKPSKRG